jgi:PDZ domain-containing protein 8
MSHTQISELDLGSQFPEIKSLELSKADLHESEGHIESLDIVMDLHYKGDFQLKIDADMVLGKKGSLSMRGEKIKDI